MARSTVLNLSIKMQTLQRSYISSQSNKFRRSAVLSIRKTVKYELPLLLIVLHIPLGLLLYWSSALAFIHPVAVFFLGLYWAIRKNEKLEKIAWIAAYIVGAEVLWRMAKSPIFWEFGKYAVITIMLVALVRRDCWKIPNLPFIYFILLVPACLLTISYSSIAEAKDQLSFNMSGPLLIFVSCWFFSYLRVNRDQAKRVLLFITIPLISIAVTTLFYTVTIEDIQFNNESNSFTSGGFGPNQVSSIMGLGVFACLSAYLLFKNSLKDKAYLILMILIFAAQSVLTFSRAGIYNAIGGVLIVFLFLMRNMNRHLKRFIPVFGIGVIFLLFLFPYLDDFTGGALQSRFEDTQTTGRLEIVQADFQIFLDNAFLGAGVGNARFLRKEYVGKSVGAHTEFSRVIAEHGLFGIVALFALFLGAVYVLKKQRFTIGRAFVGGAIVWSTLFMFSAGMRIAAPSFVWGLSFLTILSPQVRKKKFPRIPKNKHTKINGEAQDPI